MRRWTGFRPSRASGRARDTMTDMAYSRKERSISSWISMGSMPPKVVPVPSPSSGGGGGGVTSDMQSLSSDVQEPDVAGVGGDEVLAGLDVLAHQDAAHLVGQGGLLDVDPEQGPVLLGLGRAPELLPVHLPQALEAVELGLV